MYIYVTGGIASKFSTKFETRTLPKGCGLCMGERGVAGFTVGTCVDGRNKSICTGIRSSLFLKIILI